MEGGWWRWWVVGPAYNGGARQWRVILDHGHGVFVRVVLRHACVTVIINGQLLIPICNNGMRGRRGVVGLGIVFLLMAIISIMICPSVSVLWRFQAVA